MEDIRRGKIIHSFDEGLEAAVNGTIPNCNDRPYWPKIKRVSSDKQVTIPVSWGNAARRNEASYCGNEPERIDLSEKSYRLSAPCIVWIRRNITTITNVRNAPGWGPIYQIDYEDGMAFDIFVCATDEQVFNAKRIQDEKWEILYKIQREKEKRIQAHIDRTGVLPPEEMGVSRFKKNPIVDWYR